jgi:hypothetical protein
MKTVTRILAMMPAAVALAFGGCRTVPQPVAVEPGRPDPALVALAERADAAIAASGDSVGREYANRLRSEHRPAWHAYFRDKGRKPGYPSQEQAVKDFEGIIERIHAAATWPAPGTFTIPKALAPPVIDGKLDDEAWKQAAVWTETYPFNTTNAGGPATAWRMTWDDACLYVAFECSDSNVVAAACERDGNVYNDDCVEMFILPEFRFRTYWEIVIAPAGGVFDSIQCKDPEKWGCNADPSQNLTGMRHAERVSGTLNQSEDADQGYTVEVAVPFNELPGYTRGKPEAGQRLRVMLARLDRGKDGLKPYAFRPLQAWGHNIWNHAVIVLDGPGQR